MSSLISIPAAACVLVACVVVSATLCDATDTDTRDGISRGTHTRRDRVWLSGDMHLHSYHSADAPNNPSQTLVRLARERGLDFLSVCSHMYDSHMYIHTVLTYYVTLRSERIPKIQNEPWEKMEIVKKTVW